MPGALGSQAELASAWEVCLDLSVVLRAQLDPGLHCPCVPPAALMPTLMVPQAGTGGLHYPTAQTGLPITHCPLGAETVPFKRQRSRCVPEG